MAKGRRKTSNQDGWWDRRSFTQLLINLAGVVLGKTLDWAPGWWTRWNQAPSPRLIKSGIIVCPPPAVLRLSAVAPAVIIGAAVAREEVRIKLSAT
jgi:hypothetical protein